MRARLTVVEQVHYQPAEGEIVTTDCSWGEFLEGEEQPYVRNIKALPQWQALDRGWVLSCSLLVLKNEGSGTIMLSLTPSRESPMLIGPKKSVRFTPSSLATIELCSDVPCRAVLTLIPS